MYALPEQTLEEALADVRSACALAPAHISHYQLTLEPGTVFHARPPPLPDEDAAFAMQRDCQRLLAESGFEQYEVSAYARAGARCRHNLNYWTFGDYVGIGAGAHGKLTFALARATSCEPKSRASRASYLERLEARVPRGRSDRRRAQRRRVRRGELPFEFMLNALRLNEGFANARFRAADRPRGAGAVEPALARALRRGLLETTPATAGGRPSSGAVPERPCRPVFWNELIHIGCRTPPGGAPTAHCVCFRSDATS